MTTDPVRFQPRPPVGAPPTKYPTTVKKVREISLTGLADGAVWSERLAAEGLRPHLIDGRAELMLLACDSRFKGKYFAELSLSIGVSNTDDGARRDGAFLLTAFNSVRFFAWVERTIFKTPYVHSDVRLEPAHPASFSAHVKRSEIVRGSMTKGERPVQPGEAGWEGPIYIPTPAVDGAPRRHFWGRLVGPSERWAFAPESDALQVNPRDAADPLRLLLDTGFEPTHWQARVGAVHSRSKTTTVRP